MRINSGRRNKSILDVGGKIGHNKNTYFIMQMVSLKECVPFIRLKVGFHASVAIEFEAGPPDLGLSRTDRMWNRNNTTRGSC
ncbi:hypothetical protein Pan110_43660 [Gimesia panareensis]|nr:hypothetical protein Pan110_43660 [Gimesia panareensis]